MPIVKNVEVKTNDRRRRRRRVKRVEALTAEEVKFAEEYILDHDADAAAARCGIPSDRVPALLGSNLVLAAIQMAKHRRVTRTEIYGDEVVRRWATLVLADPRELVQVRLVNCRHCWGLDHRYQFRDHELREAIARHRHQMMELPEARRVEFDDLGGGGFDGGRDPMRGPLWVQRQLGRGIRNVPTANSDHSCPSCDGDGQRTVWLNDSRFYSKSAALLYQGVKVSKDGSLELKMRDQQHAEKMLAEHLGLFVQRNVNLDIDLTQLSDEQLDHVLCQFAHLAEREAGPLVEHSPSGEDETIEG